MARLWGTEIGKQIRKCVRMKRKIFIAGVWGAGNINIMEQVGKGDDIEFLRDYFRFAVQIRYVWKIINQKLGGYGSGVVRKFLRTSFFDRMYALSHCDFDNNEENDIVIFNSALLHYYTKEYFERLRQKYPNIRYILYIIDPMPDGLWCEIEDAIGVFDEVMSMHPYNCKRYGFKYLPYVYEQPIVEEMDSDIEETELFYCGVLDDYRLKIIGGIAEQCEKYQIDFDFWLKPYGNNPIQNRNIHYAMISYEENVQRLKKATCILEIMHKGYVGITQRYLEAIVYNKRLLSNNQEIEELPYYNPRYMQYFEKVEDIDWDWLCSDEEVNYHYKSDFSARVWKEKLLGLLNE